MMPIRDPRNTALDVSAAEGVGRHLNPVARQADKLKGPMSGSQRRWDWVHSLKPQAALAAQGPQHEHSDVKVLTTTPQMGQICPFLQRWSSAIKVW